MNKLKTGLLAATGVVVGSLTLRALRRRRRTTPRDDAAAAAGAAVRETETAAEHAVSAAGHARVAGEKSVEYAREELDAAPDDPAEDTADASGGRLRRARRRLIRR